MAFILLLTNKNQNMRKYLLLLNLFLTASAFAQNAEYQFDYNIVNRVARLWTDYEITVEYDAFYDRLLHADYIFEEGYVYKQKNDGLEKVGFYNNVLLVVNQQQYELKNPTLGRIAVKQKENRKWIRIKQAKNAISFIEDAKELPEVVKIWALRAALQREITFIEQQLYEKTQIGTAAAHNI